MSDGFNTVTLLGNLGGDPELKMTSIGAVLKINLATNHSWTDKESKQKHTKVEWHDVTVFGTRAEGLARHLKKGQQILVQGRLETSSWEKDGQKRYRTSIIANDIRFGNSPRPNGDLPRPAETPMSLSADLPF